jgi:uncharacterized repeat protein (TIGR03806 family)
MKRVVGLLCLAVMVASCGGGGGGGADGTAGGNTPAPSPTPAPPGAFGLDARATPTDVQIPIAASNTTTLNAVDSTRPRQFGTTTMTHAGDGTDRLFVAWGGGVIRIHERGTNDPINFLDIRDRVDATTGEGGLLGLAFDPSFRTNGYLYVYYVHCPAPCTPNTSPLSVRISRFTDTARGADSANPASEVVLREIPHPARSHYAGWLGFGPDGMLYISRGDGEQPAAAQDPNQLFGKILRVRVNNSANTLEAPSDNPFGNEVWAMGFRNPFRCSFDRAGNRDLWCGDVGQSEREEVNRVRRGGNYGWPVYEGDLPFNNPSNRPYGDFDAATYIYPHSVGVAVIGGFVYRGTALPGLTGRYVFGDYISSNLWAITTDASGGFAGIDVVATMPGGLSIQALGEDETGEIYAAPPSGPILAFQAAGTTGPETPMPATLSATGLFSDTPALTAAAGLIDYSINAPFWSNGAQKRRWFRLPAGSTIGFDAAGAWTFPVGTITVKHFDLGTTKVETRVMVHRTDGWRGFSYRWRADGQDADLVAENGDTATYANQAWNFPSRTQCLQCHTAPSRALGLNTRQFNASHSYASTGRSDNQLRTLNHIGIFSSDIGDAGQYATMPNPADPSAGTIEARARAYLDTNCSICHQPGGGTPVDMDLRFGGTLADLKIINVAASQSTATRVLPGDPSGSDLWQRLQSSGANRMPPVGVQVVDQEAVQLLSTWITQLQ